MDCESLGFCSGMTEVPVLLGYGTALLGKWFPTFQDYQIVLKYHEQTTIDMKSYPWIRRSDLSETL